MLLERLDRVSSDENFLGLMKCALTRQYLTASDTIYLTWVHAKFGINSVKRCLLKFKRSEVQSRQPMPRRRFNCSQNNRRRFNPRGSPSPAGSASSSQCCEIGDCLDTKCPQAL
eukprot:Gregarina_sp_Poly_1__1852@NODE_1482_length_4034_cov_11_704815_g982_i0_p2_GENE_NODE_1482_length_4034_cov_11_704815_g982_i0NODE_1482_length_4034_cov_11_704815_g982_i0_p2_ORF_typecomplete_len114_score4_68YobH/PF13996_6/0_015_NODE_1482_length_4034_cov_11_704815_g982_i013551696